MTTADLKIELFRTIDSMNIETLKNLKKHIKNITKASSWEPVTPESLEESITIGWDDLKNGRSKNYKEVISTLKHRYEKKDWYDELTDEQKQDIEEGLDDLKNGRVHTHESVMNEVRSRLSKK
jgi:hypothetical protein